MNDMNEFDTRLESMRKQARGLDKVDHEHTLDAATYVYDTLELCRAAARSLNVGVVTLDHVIAIYDRVEAERSRLAREEADESS